MENTSYQPRYDTCLHRLFEEQVARTPDHPALIFEGAMLTYRELDQRANQLGRYLQRCGCGPERGVGIYMERSLELVIALYAVLKAGGAYIPLDPTYPEERIAFMLADTATPIVLTQAHLRARLPAVEATIVCVDADRAIAQEPADPLPGLATPGNSAYIIYTSGSTGRPKGVVNIHRGICNRILWMQDAYLLKPDDKVLQKTPFSFDVSVWEFFWPLLTGATLVVARPEGHKDPAYLREIVIQEQITTMHFVPSMLDIFLQTEDIERCTSLRRVIASGEALANTTVAHFFQRLGCELHNLYGPTEAAVDVTAWDCSRPAPTKTVPIGFPIDNIEISLLDERLQPVGPDVPGELHIGGVGLARGYLGRPALTAERFIPHPCSTVPGARLYKTGDLARRTADGTLEFIERKDLQIKLRGFRIELGEIESVLEQHPQVLRAITTVFDDSLGYKYLAAYYLPGPEQPGARELRHFLRSRLPEYMVPQTFMPLETLPTTANGKLDRRALPRPERGRSALETSFVVPRSWVEQELASIWRDLFKFEQIGVHDSFLALDGHSLLAAQLVMQIRAYFGAHVPLRAMLTDGLTIANLAQIVEEALLEEVDVGELEALLDTTAVFGEDKASVGSQPNGRQEVAAQKKRDELVKRIYQLPPAKRDQLFQLLLKRKGREQGHAKDLGPAGPATQLPACPAGVDEAGLPVTFEQERRLVRDEQGPKPQRFQISQALRLRGPLHQEAFEQSLRAILARHEGLRAVFFKQDGHWRQRTTPVPLSVLERRDLSRLAPEAQESMVHELIRTEARYQFDQLNGPLIHAFLLCLSESEHIFLIVIDHIVCDGWSLSIFNRELSTLYNAFVKGQPAPLPALPLQQADFTRWQREHVQGQERRKAIDYWKGVLDGLRAPQLRTDYPRSSVHTFEGASLELVIADELLEATKKLAQEENVTLFVVMMSIFTIFIYEYSGDEDITISTPFSTRQQQEFEQLIGNFTNKLLIRTKLQRESTFAQLLSIMRESIFDAYTYKDLPLELLEEYLAATIFKGMVFLTFNNFLIKEPEFDSLAVEKIELDIKRATADLGLSVMEVEGRLRVIANYRLDLFRHETITVMLERFLFLLAHFVHNPHSCIDLYQGADL